MILVTGGAGYIGSHCVLNLLDSGYDVVVFDSLETGHIETIESFQTYKTKGEFKSFIKGDLKNFDEINSVFKQNGIDTVIHFAAYSQVGESVINPQKYYKNNVDGSLNLFKAMLENGVKRIVFSSSAAVYGEPDYTPIDEEHPQKPINPYGKSKLMIENILDDYSKAYDLRSVRLRYFNVAGADSELRTGEWHEPETHLIPNILKSTFSGGKIFEIFGDDYDTVDGTCIRDYINIQDLVNAHILALKYLENGGQTDYFNLGTSLGNSVKQVFSACNEVVGKNIDVVIKPKREGDPAILVADNKKALNVLGWKPERSLTESIETAYNWEKILNKRQ